MDEKKFYHLIDASPIPYALNDEKQNITYLNPSFIQTFGYSLKDIPILDKWWPKAYPDADYRNWVSTTWQKHLNEVKQTGEPFQPIELIVRCKNGQSKTVLASAASLEEAYKGIHLVILYDITERKKMENEHNETLALLKNVINSTPDLIFVKNKQLQTILCNKAFSNAVDKRPEEMYGKTDIENGWDVELVKGNPEQGIRGFMHDDKEALSGIVIHNPYDPANVNGQIRIFDTHKLPLLDSTNEIIGVLGISRDITARKKAEEKVEFYAYHDILTKLPNRLLVQDRMKHAISHAQRNGEKIALLFLDIDDFKAVNSTLGHVIGDKLLISVVNKLKECLRDSDTISRHGGDEFLVIVEDVQNIEMLETVCEKILRQLDSPFDINGHHLVISLSIGIAMYPADGDSFDTLLKKTDTAMYQAKQAGKNTFRFYNEQMNVDAEEYFKIRIGLKEAIEKQQFELHFQPQINLNSGQISGAEALIRWQHPKYGLVPPARFISLAEDSGLIIPIGKWVLETACRKAALWHSKGYEISIAVNLSSIQFKRGDLESTVIEALNTSGLKPQYLELELTESILIQDDDNVLNTIKCLKSLGIKISIDDFGTGYSSLSYLKRFAVDKLKIDRSFISNMVTDYSDAAIVHAVIQMAKSLGLSTNAEGVEDKMTLEALKLHGCDEVQGYYYSPPLSEDKFREYVNQPTTIV